MIESARGVQQGCILGPLCYSAGALKILKEFKSQPPVPGARVVSFIDDITVILPPERSLDMEAIGTVTEWASREAGCRRHLPQPEEITGAASEWSPARRPHG